MSTTEINFVSLIPGFTLKNKSAIKKWIVSAIKKEKQKPGELAIVFCSDNYLLETNRKYLNHNYLTDIITFQNTENQSVSGDLLISIDRVKENAEKLKLKFSDELHRVIIHGVLHLCGYKDKSPAHKKQMTKKEDYYLNLRPF
ncbi:MAG: rRNA maturation RNase YbeY [Bacteroidota bacterium]